jgi:hypothetical protein
MLVAMQSAKSYVYKQLKSSGASWQDTASHCFGLPENPGKKDKSLREWSDSFNSSQNWMALNGVVAIASNLETYLGTVTQLALSSDVGALYGVSKQIDGLQCIKRGSGSLLDFREQVEKVTKGTWDSRINAFKRYFQNVPTVFEDGCSVLDQMRIIRNDVAHSFGRDLEHSQETGVLMHKKMKSVTISRVMSFQQKAWKIARAIDHQLLSGHIGEYEALLYYHRIQEPFGVNHSTADRAFILRKQLGREGEPPAGKSFYQNLVKYYDSL